MFSLNAQWISPNILLFGRGTSEQAAMQTARWCRHVLLVSGAGALRKNGTLDKLEYGLQKAGVRVTHYAGIASEPTTADVDKGALLARQSGCDGVFSVGGGSVLDTGKAISGMMTNEGPVLDYIAGVGKGKALEAPPAPLIALPTTAGTGSETTNNAVLIDRENNWKRSIRDDKLISDIAIIDPVLQMGLSAKATAEAGMDAICQLIEAYMSESCSALAAMVTIEGMRRSINALPGACNDDLSAREAMAYAAMLSGFAITQAGVGAAHGISAGLGAALGLGHGLGCAILLPHVMRLNARVCLPKCGKLAEALTGKDVGKEDAANAAVDAICSLNRRLRIPDSLKGIAGAGDIERIWQGCSRSTMDKNPVKLSESEWKAFIAALIDGKS